MIATTCLILALAGGIGCLCKSGSNEPRTDNTTAPAQGLGSHGIDPTADRALHQMSDLLAEAKAFRVRSTATIEEHLESGQVAQFPRSARILVRRPDCLYAEVLHGPKAFKFWHSGKELTILDVRKNLYTTIETPSRIDKMLDFLAEEQGVVFPLADLLFPNPYEVLTERVTSGTYLDRQAVGDNECHHLLFTQDNVDWQIWIDAGKAPVPRKVVITYKGDPDQPQYEGVLDEWQRATPEDKEFTPDLPKEARRVELTEILDAD
jgi:hypothetical protein